MTHRFKGIANFRDLSHSSGGIIPPGRIYRCATPSEATPEDVDYILNKLNVKTIIDLRTTAESAADIGENLLRSHYTVIPESSLGRLNQIEHMRGTHERMLFHVPVLPSNLSFLRELSYSSRAKLAYYGVLGYTDQAHRIVGDMMVNLKLNGLYRLILKTSWKNILRTLELLSNPRNYPVMIHCTQGKDRTGMIANLLLHVCEVDEKKISEDYAHSEKELEPMRMNSEYMKRNFARAESLGLDMTSWMLSPIEAIEETHAWVQNQFGGYAKYMEWIRFSSVSQAFLHQVLVRTDQQNRSQPVTPAIAHADITDSDSPSILTPFDSPDIKMRVKEEQVKNALERVKLDEGVLIPDVPPPIPKRPPKNL
ncbi:hypothetical protein PROFUN_12561 [Planoprotostelium fungivorum]|uniref:Tyrosine specific protein phosphatases domain-containing protein n=1 Tax=Planoprotostelium fungivorum TaxID=1890364 RepID=A0A2P6N795_9EUKA|nr:hypothetical protein PROFUN_12561 [Planoprotostelium fungivorum]